MYVLYDQSSDIIPSYDCICNTEGKYSIKFILDFGETDYSKWADGGADNSNIKKMFDMIPKSLYESNEVFFTIK